jgi:hypothetical protein
MIETNKTGNALVYQTAVNQLMVCVNNDQLLFSDIDYALLEKFSNYLIKKGLRVNTISNYIRTVRAIYNKAIKLKPDDLLKINGIAKISAELFIENIPKYYDFYDSLGFKCKGREVGEVGEVKKASNNNFKDKIFIFSGFRNKDYEKIIEDNGGKVSMSISKPLMRRMISILLLNYLIVLFYTRIGHKMMISLENDSIEIRSCYMKIIRKIPRNPEQCFI